MSELANAFGTVLIIGLVLSFCLWLIVKKYGRFRRCHKAVVAAGARRGANFLSAANSRQIPEVELRKGALVIRLRTTLDSERAPSSSVFQTRFVGGAGPRFHIYPRGSFASGGSKIGDDEVFDGRFVVDCENLEATRQLWTLDARRALHHLVTAYDALEAKLGAVAGEVKSDGESIMYTQRGGFRSSDDYDIAFQLMSILAGAPLGPPPPPPA
jgi:hypothetical protein